MSSNVKLTEHKAHMTRDAEVTLVEILHEIHHSPSGSYYEVFWYHWPSDGIFPWEDFEPVVFAYDGAHELCFVMVRRGWKPVTSSYE